MKRGRYMIKKLYPKGCHKAFNFTYDDGILQDVRFVTLLNQYGIKGTFNLNSELMKNEFEWTHENGMIVKRLPKHVAVSLYEGHEVASHTLTHPYMIDLSENEIMYQLAEDKKNLEKLFEKTIYGFAVPFDYYDDRIASCVKNCGFEYGRNSQETYSYKPNGNEYYWSAGAFHLSPAFSDFVERFWNTQEELAVCQIVGHSYDLDAEDMWEYMEDICKRVQEDADILPMTTIELVHYLKSMKNTVIEEHLIRNYSNQDLWFEVDGNVVVVKAGEVWKC